MKTGAERNGFFTHENQWKPNAYRKPKIYRELANIGHQFVCQTKDDHSRRPFIIVEIDPTKYF